MYHPLANACSTHHLLDTPLYMLPAVHTLIHTHTLPAVYIAHKVYTTCCTHHPPPPLPDTRMCTHAQPAAQSRSVHTACQAQPCCTHHTTRFTAHRAPHHTQSTLSAESMTRRTLLSALHCCLHSEPWSQAPGTSHKQFTLLHSLFSSSSPCSVTLPEPT